MIPQPPSISAPENVAAFTPYQSAQPLKSSCFFKAIDNTRLSFLRGYHRHLLRLKVRVVGSRIEHTDNTEASKSISFPRETN